MKHLLNSYTLTLVCLLAVATSSFAQGTNLDDIPRVSETLWSVKSTIGKDEVTWVKLTASGSYIVAALGSNPNNNNLTTAHIAGHSAVDGRLLFDNFRQKDLPVNMDEESYEEVNNSPFFLVSNRKKKTDYYMVNSLDGKVTVNTQATGLNQVYNHYVLPQAAMALFIGRAGSKSVVAGYNLKTGESWVQEKLLRFAMVEERVAGAPLEVDANTFILPTESGLYAINAHTGEKKWRVNLSTASAITMTSGPSSSGGNRPSSEGSISGMFGKKAEEAPETNNGGDIPPALLARHADKSFVYLLNANGLMAYDINSGKQLWKKFARGDGNSTLIFDPNGLIVIGDKLYMYDYDSGNAIWSKPVKAKGRVDDYQYTPHGLVLAIQSGKMKGGYELNVLDTQTGTLKFDDNHAIPGSLLEMLACGAGVFYTTDFSVNIWDASTGKDAFEPILLSKKREPFRESPLDLTYTRPPNGYLLTDYKNEMAYVFNAETMQLFEIDTEKGTKREVTKTPFSFEDKKEPDYMEVRENGIFLASAQNAALINFQGEVLFNINLPSAEYGLFAKMLASAAQTYDTYRKTADSPKRNPLTISDVRQQMKGESTWSKTKSFVGANSRVTVNMDAVNNILNNRFEMSKQSKNYYYIHTKLQKWALKNGLKPGSVQLNEFGVVKIDKETGKPVRILSFGTDRAPQFVIDEVTDKLFYLDGGTLKCYQM